MRSRALFIAVLLSACNTPDIEAIDECGPNGTCPDGFECNTRSRRCVALGSSVPDAATPDAATPDTASPDAATPDTPRPDAASPDAAAPDAPRPDASAPDDSPPPDAPPPDAPPPPDASPPDAAPPPDAAAPPTTLLVDTPEARTAETRATFGFAGGARFECALDGAAFSACDSPLSRTVEEGFHTFAVVAFDEAGTPDPTASSFEWEVDLSGPFVFISGPSAGATTGRDVQVGFGTEGEATVRCALDREDLEPCTRTLRFTGLAGGGHTLRVQATDDLGNPGPLASRAFFVDAAGPTVTIAPFQGDITSEFGTVHFTASESGSTFECSMDFAAFAPCAASGLPYFALDGGAHTVLVRATDGFENLGPNAAYSWTVIEVPR